MPSVLRLAATYFQSMPARCATSLSGSRPNKASILGRPNEATVQTGYARLLPLVGYHPWPQSQPAANFGIGIHLILKRICLAFPSVADSFRCAVSWICCLHAHSPPATSPAGRSRKVSLSAWLPVAKLPALASYGHGLRCDLHL